MDLDALTSSLMSRHRGGPDTVDAIFEDLTLALSEISRQALTNARPMIIDAARRISEHRRGAAPSGGGPPAPPPPPPPGDADADDPADPAPPSPAAAASESLGAWVLRMIAEAAARALNCFTGAVSWASAQIWSMVRGIFAKFHELITEGITQYLARVFPL